MMSETEKIYTTKEIAEKHRVSVPSVVRWLQSGELKGYRVNKLWRVKEEDLLRFIEESMGAPRRGL